MHEYRDIYEFYNPCFYCCYEGIMTRYIEAGQIFPPIVCEECPGGKDYACEYIDEKLMAQMEAKLK